MLRKLSKHMRASGNAKFGLVDFKNPLVSQIARRHQAGIGETMTAIKMKQCDKSSNNESNASRVQAKKLLALNYRIKKIEWQGLEAAKLALDDREFKTVASGIHY